MSMLDRYLQAVRFFLPAKQQDDIVRELSENLISQMEDREEELGRPSTKRSRPQSCGSTATRWLWPAATVRVSS
jgi:hypothetical protein